MNPHEEPLPALDPQTLDLLIDGELPEAERRRLLAGLDHVPGGWRACALAFLEAQCWREEMRAERRAPADGLGGTAGFSSSAGSPAIVSRHQPWPRRIVRWGGTLLAMAASFLLAFVAATALRSPRETGIPGVPGGERFAGIARGVPDAGAPVGASEAGGLGESLAQARPAPAPEGLSPSYRLVTITVPGEEPGTKRTIRVPAIEADRIDDAWLASDSETMPADVRAALEQFGYRVGGFRRQLIPLPTDDGRRLVLPVDQVELHYVGNPSYQ